MEITVAGLQAIKVASEAGLDEARKLGSTFTNSAPARVLYRRHLPQINNTLVNLPKSEKADLKTGTEGS